MTGVKTGLFLDALGCKETKRPPVWLMRQAGRYLPEYRSLRLKHSLTTLFHDPELAAEVTLLPLKRFALDAAILFSDLLIPLEVFAINTIYPEEGGLYLEPKVENGLDLKAVSKEEIAFKLPYVFETIKLLKPVLQVPLVGFCGAPFTLLCYLLQGSGGHSFSSVRVWMEKRSVEFFSLLDTVCNMTVAYAQLQAEAGAEAIQIFDSWTHLLSKEEFLTYALPYWKRIADALKLFEVPCIFFSRTNSFYAKEIASLFPDGISFDEGKPLALLRSEVPEGIAVQGNFSPVVLASASAAEVKEKASAMARSVSDKKGIIFNLGHGVLPNTPVENVSAFLEGLSS